MPITPSQNVLVVPHAGHIRRVLMLAQSRKSKVTLRPLPTAGGLFREAATLFRPSSEKTIISQTTREALKCILGLGIVLSQIIKSPRRTWKAYRTYRSGSYDFQEWWVRNTPIENPKCKGSPRGAIWLIPYEQFKNKCFAKGDSRWGMELKEDNDSPITVEHNGETGRLYWICDKRTERYEILHRLFGTLGTLGAVNHDKHMEALSMVNYQDYFFAEAIKSKRTEIAEIILANVQRIEKLIESGDEIDLKNEWRKSISETLCRCVVGNIPQDRMDFFVRISEEALQYILRTKALSLVPGITIFSKRNQKGEIALRELDTAGLELLIERLQLLHSGKEPKDLFDQFALVAAKLIEEGASNPEEIIKEVSKMFFEMIGAGNFTRFESRSNFDHLALTDNDFRKGLINALGQFKSEDLGGMIQEVLQNEDLLKPFCAATCAALAYQPTIPFVARNSRVVFRGLDQSSPKDEIIELRDDEVKQLIEKYKLNHPLLKISQNQRVFYSFAGYCRIGLERNGFIKNDGQLNSETVFHPGNFDKINEIGRWQFAMGARGCIGEMLAMETLTWDALCMAYLLRRFPDLKVVGETKTKIGLFIGKEFKVRNLAQVTQATDLKI